MNGTLKLLTEPTLTILGITETKNYLKVETDVDDDLIEDLIDSSVAWIENETYIDTTPRQWQQNIEGGTKEIELYKGPVASIDEIKKFDDFESTGTLLTESTDFRISDQYLIHVDNYWEQQRSHDGYQIKYTTGLWTSSTYTSSNDQRLKVFKSASLKMVGWLYENRELFVSQISEAFSITYNYEDVPQTVKRLLRPYTRGVFM